MAETILVLGGPNTGKTHFTGQLYGRLRQPESTIKLLSSPSDLGPIEQVLNRLGEGCVADHTSRSADYRMPWSLEMPSGAYAEIIWPDYGGEQITDILERRIISFDWQERIIHANNWILFIRPLNVHQSDDYITRSKEDAMKMTVEAPHQDVLRPWSDATYLIELLQILLWVRRCEIGAKRNLPKIAILLSCWDELSTDALPVEVLRDKLALLAEFLYSNWYPDDLRLFGLSSLGKALSKTEADHGYQDRGPEAYGYIILPNGQRSSDLTLPLSWLLDNEL